MVLGFAVAIYRLIFEWDNNKNDLLSVFEINRGGLAIYGGVLGGVAVALIYCRVKRISFWSLADTLMPSLVLGQAIGRWGNCVNQEAYGNQITNPSLCFFSLRRLHRRNRPMAAGNLFLRICIEFSFTHRYADMLPAFQAKRLSSSVLYDRVRNDTVFCGGAAL